MLHHRVEKIYNPLCSDTVSVSSSPEYTPMKVPLGIFLVEELNTPAISMSIFVTWAKLLRTPSFFCSFANGYFNLPPMLDNLYKRRRNCYELIQTGH